MARVLPDLRRRLLSFCFSPETFFFAMELSAFWIVCVHSLGWKMETLPFISVSRNKCFAF